MDATTFAALGQPSRLRIVELLRDGPRSVTEVVEALDIRQPQVSKHLHVLSDAGIVEAEAVARRRIYHLRSDRFAEIDRWVDSFERAWEARLDSLGSYLDALDPKETGDG
jgi:DNA-binding transcriptional ArsR family regulator